MSRRLRSMSEESLESSPRSSGKMVEEAGFSEELRQQLEQRIASANFKAEHRSAFAEVEAPSHAGRGSRDIAAASPWTGEESIHDASLRMLTDAHKPLRGGGGKAKMPTVATPPKSIDTGRSRTRASAGTRLANARDRTSIYATLKDGEMSEKEREARFKELKDRFSPHARSVVPGTIQGLASLANERIEDAISRGQFKNISMRGKQIERDYNASSPFLDTTEYFLNKMIQKQEIVPPWIEKQQELVGAASKFRARLRNDWKRHAARTIASKGGSLQEQMRKAEAYAAAELIVNPPKKKEEKLNRIDDAGHVSQISLSGELKVPTSSSNEPAEAQITVTEIPLEEHTSSSASSQSTPSEVSTEPDLKVEAPLLSASTAPEPEPTPDISPAPSQAPIPFRDPHWLSTESSYLNLSITHLNTLTRSYNLQAPDLAKKPYFSLPRELNACYSDVAPQVASAIRERALAPKAKMEGFSMGKEAEGLLGKLGSGVKVKVRDERPGRRYGFRELWKDVWGAGGA